MELSPEGVSMDKLKKDLRTVDDVVMFTGEALKESPEKTMVWRCIYGLAVAVEHLLEEAIRNKSD